MLAIDRPQLSSFQYNVVVAAVIVVVLLSTMHCFLLSLHTTNTSRSAYGRLCFVSVLFLAGWANSADDKMIFFSFLFSPEIRI